MRMVAEVDSDDHESGVGWAAMTKVAQLLGVTTPETIPTCREWRRSLVSM